MVQHAVPVATTSWPLTDWQLTGAATAHEATDEGVDTPDDGATQAWDRNGAPFLTTIPPGGPGDGKAAWFEVQLGPVTDPGVTTGHTMRARFKIGETTWSASTHGRFSLYQGSGLDPANLIVSKLLPDPGSTGWVTYTHDLSNAQAARITNYTDLRFELQTNSVRVPSLFRVSTLDLLVPDPVPSEIQRVHGTDLQLRVASDLALGAAVNLEQALDAVLWRDQLRHLVVNLQADSATPTWREGPQALILNRAVELEAAHAQVKALDLRAHRVQDQSSPTWREHDMHAHLNLEATLAFDLAQKDLST